MVMKTLGGEQYVVIEAYKFATFEILRFLVSYVYCMPMLSLHIESTDSIIYFRQQLYSVLKSDGSERRLGGLS